MDNSLLCSIWFSIYFDSKHRLSEMLLSRYGSAENVFAQGEKLFSLPEVMGNTLEFSLEQSQAIAEYCERNQIGIVAIDDERYPKRLKEIKDRPLILYYRGNFPSFDEKLCIAMVGTRKMTDYGERSAYSIAYDIAKSDSIVVSGMAAGVDGASHRGALDASGLTVAVLGCGVDRVYPSEHDSLMAEIIDKGCVISEYIPGTPPIGSNFPRRNRIISGLSQATFVVEANSRSGSLITARCALSQGREIFALPGAVGELNSNGTNELLSQGARMARNAKDILSEYANEFPSVAEYIESNSIGMKPVKKAATARISETPDFSRKKKESAPSVEKPSVSGNNVTVSDKNSESQSVDKQKNLELSNLSDGEAGVYNCMLEHGKMTSDEIIAFTSLSASEVMTSLTMLEIKGIIESAAGGKFRII